MGRSRKQLHVHKYQRMQFKYSGRIWACRLPDCTHYIPKDMEETIEGKFCVCWGCGNEFLLTEDSLKDDQPRCESCIEAERRILEKFKDRIHKEA